MHYLAFNPYGENRFQFKRSANRKWILKNCFYKNSFRNLVILLKYSYEFRLIFAGKSYLTPEDMNSKGDMVQKKSSMAQLNMDCSTGELEKSLFSTYDRIIKMVSDTEICESDFLFGVGDRVLNSHQRLDPQRSRSTQRAVSRPSFSKGSSLPPLNTLELPETQILEKLKGKNPGNLIELEDLLDEAEQLVEIEDFLEKYSMDVLENLEAEEFEDEETNNPQFVIMKEMIKAKFGFNFSPREGGESSPKDIKAILDKPIQELESPRSDFGGESCTEEVETPRGLPKVEVELEKDDVPIVDLEKNEPFIQQIKKCREAMKTLELKETLLFGKEAEKAFGGAKETNMTQIPSQGRTRSKFHLPPLKVDFLEGRGSWKTFTKEDGEALKAKKTVQLKPLAVSASSTPRKGQGRVKIDAMEIKVKPKSIIKPETPSKRESTSSRVNAKVSMGSKDFSDLKKADIEKWKQNYAEMKEKKKNPSKDKGLHLKTLLSKSSVSKSVAKSLVNSNKK